MHKMDSLGTALQFMGGLYSIHMGCLYYFGPNIQKENNKIRSHKWIAQFCSQLHDSTVDDVILQSYDMIMSQ